jgi:hypothetical protein
MTENKISSETTADTGLRKLSIAAYSTRDLKKIYFRSESIKSIAALILIATIAEVLKGFITIQYGGKDIIMGTITKPMNTVLILANVLSFVGLVTRTAWGRIVASITCTIWIASPIWLSHFSIFLLFGIWGLLVLIPGDNLFGPSRILSNDLKTELKWRKENKSA